METKNKKNPNTSKLVDERASYLSKKIRDETKRPHGKNHMWFHRLDILQ